MTKKDKQKEKQERLAQALRNNLRRRKQQPPVQTPSPPETAETSKDEKATPTPSPRNE